MRDGGVIAIRPLIDWEEHFLGVESEVFVVIVREVVGAAPVAHDEELDEGEQGVPVAIAGVLLVINDLLHGAAWIDV